MGGFFKRFFNRLARPVSAARGFQGALMSRLSSGWLSTLKSVDADLKAALPVLVARSRDLKQNNDYVRRYFQLLKTNVVGHTGIQFQAKQKKANGEPDKEANDRYEAAWTDWGRSCDMTGRLTWKDALNLAVEQLAECGEILCRLVMDKRNPYGLALHFIEPLRLDVNYNEDKPNGNRVVMGVEMDPWGRPVTYHILTAIPGEYGGRRTTYREPIPASEIIHAFIVEYATQTRGVPWTATAMKRLRQLGEYEHAALVAARIGAAKMGFIFSPDGETEGDEGDDKGNTIEEVEPGQITTLPHGYQFQGFDPKYPAEAYDPFVRRQLKGIAAGLGVSYVSLANDLEGVNFSSIRQGVLDERDFYRAIQQFIIDRFCNPVREAWHHGADLKGKLTGPNQGFAPMPPVKWQPRTWAWVDPLKDVKASIEAVKGNLTTLTDVAAESGRDFAEIVETKAAEQKLAEKAGVELNPATAKGGATVGK